MIKESISLYFKDGSSDKFYSIAIEENNGTFSVPFTYGRTGTSGLAGAKVVNADYAKAKKAFDSVVREKMAKGYQPGAGQAVQAGILPAGAPKVLSGFHAQLLNPIDESEASRYITDDSYGMQEKFNGKHLSLKRLPTSFTAINKKGIECGYPQIYKTATDNLTAKQFIIDGEDVNSVYDLYDILELDGRDLRGLTYLQRYELLAPFSSKTLRVAYLAKSTTEKRALFEKLKKENKEGVVFKKLNAIFSPGKAHTDMWKAKFYATLSARVAKGREGKRSIGLELLDDKGTWVFMGNCTIGGNKDIPSISSIVEIRYLYAHRGGSLYQPTYLGVRDDVDPEECKMTQIKYKAEED